MNIVDWKVSMKNYIAGLFQTRKEADEAYLSLQEAGFDNQDIKILSRKETGTRPVRESVSIKSVAIGALIGALIGGGIAAILGFLISQGVLDIPAFFPLPEPFFALNTFGLFLAQGAVTGAILGVVARLAMAREKPAFTRAGITHGGVVLAVNAEDHQSSNAKQVIEKAGAIDVVNLSEKWDQKVWSDFKELQPPSIVS